MLLNSFFLKTAFLKLVQIGRNQLLSHAEQNEKFLRAKIHNQNILISKTINDKESAIHNLTEKVIQMHRENQRLSEMAPSQPFFHWMASNEELLQWHTDNFEIKGSNSSPTVPYQKWMEDHKDFNQWHSHNFIKRNKAHSVFSQFLPFLNLLHRLLPSSLKRCFIKWTLFLSQEKHLERLADDFKTTKKLNFATLSSCFFLWKIKHLQHKNTVLSSIALCYQESTQHSLQEMNRANSRNFDLRNQLSKARMDITTQN